MVSGISGIDLALDRVLGVGFTGSSGFSEPSDLKHENTVYPHALRAHCLFRNKLIQK